jgi:type II secretory pathway pseudopilin PulG
VKKKRKIIKLLPWLPRILSAFVLILISTFFWLNFLEQYEFVGLNKSLWIQLIPLLLTIAVLLFAWAKPLVGVIFFPIIGFIYYLTMPGVFIFRLSIVCLFLSAAAACFAANYAHKKLKHFNESAFTIIEYIVVVFIIALLSTATSVVYAGFRIKLDDVKRVASLKQIASGLDAYYRTYNVYPSVLTTGSGLVGSGGEIYLTKIPSDPAHPAESLCPATGYQYFNLGRSYQVTSCLDGPVGNLLPGGIMVGPGKPPSNISQISDLVGYWTFNEGASNTAFDYSGYGHNGVWYGSGPNHYESGFNQTPAGKFNGVNDYVRVPSDDLLNAHSLTIALWIKASEITGHNYILEKGSPSQFGISLENGQNHGELEFFLDDDRTCGSKTKSFEGEVILTTDVWNFVAFSFDDDSNILKIYVNGQLDKQYLYTGCTPINDGDLYIGRKVDGSQGYEYGGLMDNVSFYNRALTDSEVLSVYNVSK